MGLDGMEIVMAWEESFGIHITDAEAVTLRTTRAAIDLICRRLEADSEGSESCLSQRAFHRLRAAFVKVLPCSRASVIPTTRFSDLVPYRGRRRTWHALSAAAGVPFPKRFFGFGTGNYTVGDLTREVVAQHPNDFRDPTRVWTRPQVRQVVRAVISSQLGIQKFSDDADFVTDLRID